MKVTHKLNRLPSIDLARGLAVFFMIAVHVLVFLGSAEVYESAFGQIIDFLGSPPAAPVFMTLMGFSLIYSRKKGLKTRLLRGLKIILLGYLLNILRGTIPFEIGKYLEVDVVVSPPLSELSGYIFTVAVDILQFAGVALMILAIIQELKINKWIILFMSLIVSLVSPLLWGIATGIPVVDFVLDIFWGDHVVPLFNNLIGFPVFPWLAFPLLGMFLGETIKNSPDQEKSFKTIGIVGVVVLIVGLVLITIDPEYHLNDYYHSRQGAMIFMCGFVMAWLYLTKLLTDYIPDNPVFRLLYSWSRGVTSIYFIQWIIIFWSFGILGVQKCSYFAVVVLIIGVTFVSHRLNLLYEKMKERKKRKKVTGKA